MSNKEQYDRIVQNIKDVIDNYVTPGVAGHGGVVNFVDYEDGTLTLQMSGACSGCAMSQKTLHEGVERMLKHYVPEVNQLVGVDDEQAAEKGYTPWAI